MAISRDVGLGRAFWRQSLADAEESRLLLSHGRIAAALVSCQHAIEKALKAALCEDWFTKRKPVEVGEHSFQLRHNISLELWKSQKLKLSSREMNRCEV
jgi:HEPN domain-containing protein